MGVLGCIADDVTGATDLAISLVMRGLRTAVLLDPRDTVDLAGLDAVVVALKSRSVEPDRAVEMSLGALDLLRAAGSDRFYFKYCSTFDSTPRGNIGPVAAALMGALGTDRTIVVPSFPDAGRTVIDGELFVNGTPLAESHMAHHPLNPMWESRLTELLAPQTSVPGAEVHLDVVRQGPGALRAALAAVPGPVIIAVDAATNEDLAVIAEATRDWPLVTAGSGLALGYPAQDRDDADAIPVVRGRRLVVAGSASAQTMKQVQSALGAMPAVHLDPHSPDAAAATEAVRAHWAQHPDEPFLVYATGSPEDVVSGANASLALERAIAEVASDAVADGARQLIVAGGETSGAVMAALGVSKLLIGPRIAPGVAWAHGVTADGIELNLALKSGNFGADDMFSSAWEVLGE